MSLTIKLDDWIERPFLDASTEAKQELLLLKAQYEEFSTSKAENSLIQLKRSYYDQGEKPGRLLPWRTKKLDADRAITAIQTQSGTITTDPQEININTSAIKYYINPNIQKIWEHNLNS